MQSNGLKRDDGATLHADWASSYSLASLGEFVHNTPAISIQNVLGDPLFVAIEVQSRKRVVGQPAIAQSEPNHVWFCKNSG